MKFDENAEFYILLCVWRIFVPGRLLMVLRFVLGRLWLVIRFVSERDLMVQRFVFLEDTFWC